MSLRHDTGEGLREVLGVSTEPVVESDESVYASSACILMSSWPG